MSYGKRKAKPHLKVLSPASYYLKRITALMP